MDPLVVVFFPQKNTEILTTTYSFKMSKYCIYEYIDKIMNSYKIYHASDDIYINSCEGLFVTGHCRAGDRWDPQGATFGSRKLLL